MLLQATRAAKAAAAAPTRAATPTGAVRVKPEPGSAAAGATAAAGSAAPSTQARSREPGTSKRTGGGRDGYAVRQSVLDDDWEEDLEDETDQLSKHYSSCNTLSFDIVSADSIQAIQGTKHHQCMCTLTAACPPANAMSLHLFTAIDQYVSNVEQK